VNSDHATSTQLEYWLAVGVDYRGQSRLDYPSFLQESPSVEQLVGRAGSCAAACLWLGGCEPTLRPDLPKLISSVAEAGDYKLGLWTDGLALQSQSIVSGLVRFGVDRVRIPVHAGRADAHDWISGISGSSRRAAKAIRLCAEVGLTVEVETVITRPTMSLVAETVEIAQRLGARAVHLRTPRCRGDWAEKYVAIAPRYGLLHPYLADLRSHPDCPVSIRGMPRCVVPDNLEYLSAETERWLIPGGSEALDAECAEGCGRCATYADCFGPPADYVERFGWLELHSQSNQVVSATAERIPVEAGAVKPPPRAGRIPATRITFAIGQSRRPTLGGDPLLGVLPQAVPDSIRVTFGGPALIRDAVLADDSAGQPVESTRTIRRRLVDAAQHGTRQLRVASAASLAHPDVAALLSECRRLSIEEVEICGEGSALAAMSDREIRRMRGINRFLFALYGPDAATHDAVVEAGAFEKTMDIAERISALIKSEVGFFGVLRSDAQLTAFDRAWTSDELPGKPRFRLAPIGGKLSGLAGALEGCSGLVQDAIVPMIPPCLFPRSAQVNPALHAEEAFGDIGAARRKPSACDVRGAYNDCPYASECVLSDFCPGLAHGWTTEHIEPVKEGMDE
jgi:MoaA/NifB/PqqE/SkfB family radical SAM enzyme